ncbi:MAG: VOC family protein [Oscillospiraceae bacterium]|jgi:catechol 2,3-dioxygenase-like lactoylglutathione lyase family enzyme|nr:VOC family protein [Oscillospiraceae bacterium]
MEGVSARPVQIAWIVRDIERTKRAFAAFLGVSEPDTVGSGEYAVTRTTYMGKPAPDADCRMAFFHMGDGLTLELIQPGGGASVWKDHLDTRGEGLHHIGFAVKGTDGVIASAEGLGMRLAQRGKYGDGGGEYAYLDATDTLKCFIETLESY